MAKVAENFGLESAANGEVRQDYKDLFQISPELRERMRGKSLALIFLESTLMSLELTNERGRLSLNTKRSSQENMESVIERKIASYDNVVKHVVLPTIDVIGSVIGVMNPASGWANLTKSFTEPTNRYLGDRQGAEHAEYDHVYQGENQLVSQHRDSQRESAQNYDKMLELWKQSVQQEQDSFRSVASVA